MVYIDNILHIIKDLNIIKGIKNKLFKNFYYIINYSLIFHYLAISITWTKRFVSGNKIRYLNKIFIIC